MRSEEHRALGQEASGGAIVPLARPGDDVALTLGFGDVVALSGDYFLPTDDPPAGTGSGPEVLTAGGLFHLAGVPGDRGTLVGTRDEIVGALRVMAVDQGVTDRRFDGDGLFAHYRFTPSVAETDVERRIRDRFLALGASNDDHFVEPGARGVETTGDRAASRFGSAPAAYRRLHEQALVHAYRLGRADGDVAVAMAREAAAQHYLTDAFAAGHLRTPVAAIREFWQHRYPGFWEGLQRKVAADTAAALRALVLPLRLLSREDVYERTLAAVRARTTGYPRISLGDLLAKVFHDWDNVHGVAIEGGGTVFGDGCLERGATRRLAVAAARAGIDDVEVAHRLGTSGAELAAEQLFRAVREATGATGRRYRAELWVPRLAAGIAPQNWQAGDIESLWEAPIVGSSGATVGQAVSEALEPGGELANRLEGLGRGLSTGLAVPGPAAARHWLGRRAGQAYHDGFLRGLMGDPRRSVMEVLAAGQADDVRRGRLDLRPGRAGGGERDGSGAGAEAGHERRLAGYLAGREVLG